MFPTFRLHREHLAPKFLEWFCKREPVWSELQRNSRGIGARRESVSPEQFFSLEADDTTISYGVLVPGPEVEDDIPFIRIQDLAVKDPPLRPAKRISPSIEKAYARTRLKGGEVLLAVVGATIGKVGVAPDAWRGANIARAVCRIIPGPKLDRDFLVYVLQSKEAQDYLQAVTRTLA